MQGVVLTGGKSSRMGTDKALIEFEGQTLLDHAVNRISEVVGSVFLSGAHQVEKLTSIPDAIAGLGPMAGIVASAEFTKDDILVLACDMPLVNEQLLQFILSRWSSRVDAVVPTDDHGRQPLCAIYNQSALPILKEALKAGKQKMQLMLNELDVQYIDMVHEFPNYSPNLFFNVNSPEDLDQLNSMRHGSWTKKEGKKRF